MITLLRAALAATLLLVTPAFAHNGVVHLGGINISAPFTRATLPNAPVGGGFLTIENTGYQTDRLISATSSVAGDTQIHEMSMQGDVMKMRELAEGLEIPAGATVALAPGGYHIMFMGLNQALRRPVRLKSNCPCWALLPIVQGMAQWKWITAPARMMRP